MPRFQPDDSLASPRFSGIRTFARLPHVSELAEVDATILGIPFDTGTSFRTGARFGPAAIREASVLVRPYNPAVAIDVFATLSVTDGGDIPIVPGYIEETYSRIEERLRPVYTAKVVPVCLGGDHSITLAELRAAAATYGPLGLVHIDAHSDTWDAYFGQKYNHGTTFRRAAEEGLLDRSRCIQVGLRGPLYNATDFDVARGLGFQLITTAEIRQRGVGQVAEAVRACAGTGPTFCSFDVDVVDPAFAPGTGTPEVGGLTSWEALGLVRSLSSLDWVAFDVVEVSPSYDPAQITALLAANVAYEFLSLLAVRRASTLRTVTTHELGQPRTQGR